jgi:DNA-binding CsgD family transcriptional regulator
MTTLDVERHHTTVVPSVPLSSRERIVLAELTVGDTLEDIGRRLYVSRNTVKSQVRSAYRKIGVSTRAEAIAWALRRSALIEPAPRRHR